MCAFQKVRTSTTKLRCLQKNNFGHTIMASISYTKGYFRTVMMLNFHAFEYSSGIAPSKVKKKNPNDLKLAHDMEWCHVPFAYQIGPGLI